VVCFTEWSNLVAGGLTTVGSGVLTYAATAAALASIAASGGTAAPGAIAAVVGSGIVLLGSLAWTVSAIAGLENCYEAAGRTQSAAQCRAQRQAIQGEHDRLSAAIDQVRALVGV